MRWSLEEAEEVRRVNRGKSVIGEVGKDLVSRAARNLEEWKREEDCSGRTGVVDLLKFTR